MKPSFENAFDLKAADKFIVQPTYLRVRYVSDAVSDTVCKIDRHHILKMGENMSAVMRIAHVVVASCARRKEGEHEMSFRS